MTEGFAVERDTKASEARTDRAPFMPNLLMVLRGITPARGGVAKPLGSVLVFEFAFKRRTRGEPY